MIIMVVSLVFISTLCVPHVMVSVFASDVVDCGCELQSGKTKGFENRYFLLLAKQITNIKEQVE